MRQRAGVNRISSCPVRPVGEACSLLLHHTELLLHHQQLPLTACLMQQPEAFPSWSFWKKDICRHQLAEAPRGTITHLLHICLRLVVVSISSTCHLVFRCAIIVCDHSSCNSLVYLDKKSACITHSQQLTSHAVTDCIHAQTGLMRWWLAKQRQHTCT